MVIPHDKSMLEVGFLREYIFINPDAILEWADRQAREHSDPYTKRNWSKFSGDTLSWLLRNNYIGLVKSLIKHYPNLEINLKKRNVFPSHASPEVLYLFVNSGFDLNQIYGCRLASILNRHPYLIKYVLMNGLNLTTYDKHNRVDLIDCANLETVKLLFENNIAVDDILSFDFFSIIIGADVNKLKFLLNAGLSLTLLEESHISIIILRSNLEKLKFLLNASLPLTKLESWVISDLISKSDPERLKLLLNSGLVVTDIDIYPDMLNLIPEKKNLLLDYGLDIDASYI